LQKLFERELLEAVTKLFGFRFADAQTNLARVVIGLRNDARLHLLHDAHDVVHHGVGERVGDDFLYLARLNLRMGDGIGSGFAVSHDETGSAEVHATIIAHDDDEDIRELIAVDLPEDGLAGSRRRLAVVVGAELQSFRTEHVGVTDVSGVEVFLAIAGKDVLDFLDCRHMMSEGEELTPLVGVIALASALECAIFVSHYSMINVQ